MFQSAVFHLPGLIISLSKDSDQLFNSSIEGLENNTEKISEREKKNDAYGSPKSIGSTGWRPSSVRTVKLKERK
jgi:hypothetical protein